jgi:hypothetical protein
MRERTAISYLDTSGTSRTAAIKENFYKFARDRRRYLYWVFEAKTRYGLCVLDYMVTSNHVHLLVKDTGGEVIAQSMQLIAGRTAQEYNERGPTPPDGTRKSTVLGLSDGRPSVLRESRLAARHRRLEHRPR